MKISIILPVYNEQELIKKCITSLINQDYEKENYEIIIINDGSKDNTLKNINEIMKKNRSAKIKVINQKNKGRVISRQCGANNAAYENLLFIDSRCFAYPDLLEKIKKLNYQPLIGNIIINFNSNIFSRFNYLFRKKLYKNSFGNYFNPVYITQNNFTGIAKGTATLFCKKKLFLNTQPKNKSKNISDDTKLLWNITKKRKILKHPGPKIRYEPRSNLTDILKHTYERGPKFIDYYLTPKKKYFWYFIFFPLFIAINTITLLFISKLYFSFLILFLLILNLITALFLSQNLRDISISFICAPIFTIIFEFGLIKGIILKIRGKL